MKRLLIAAAGNASIACIEQLLKFKHQFRITVFEDAHPPGDGPGGGLGRAGQAKLDGAHREWLRRNDIEVRSTVCVEAIHRNANVVRGCDGSRTTFDTLILAAGASNPALGRAAGLEVRSGVVVNDFMQTSDAHVYALGAGTEHRGCIYSDAETVGEQARVLAAHLAGHVPAPFRGGVTDRGPSSLNAVLLNTAGLNAVEALTTSAALPNASAGSARRSVDQTLEPANQPVLVGAA